MWCLSINFALIALFGLSSSTFPSDIKQCKYGDSECIVNTVNHIFHERGTKGVSGLNLIPIEPLAIKSVDISQGSESPVNVDLKFRNSELGGVSTVNLKKVVGFGKDVTGPHEFYVEGSQLSLTGDYEVQGRVLLLPIQGSGNSNITLVNPEFKISFNGEPYEKNGKTYMKVKNMKLDGKISRMYIFLENLFNGDKALGDNMNAFLNENWEDIYGELKDKVYEAFALIFEAVVNKVFTKYPYDEFFLQ